MTTSISADVVVIGAGAVGAATAYELSKRGASVTVLEAGTAIGRGCSFANAGLLAPSHVEPLATPANVAAGLRYMLAPDGPFYVHPTPRLLPFFARLAAAAGPGRALALTARMQELAARSLRMHGDYAASGLETGFRHSGALDVFLTESGFQRAAGKYSDASDTSQLLSGAEARQLEPTLGDHAGAIYHPDEALCGSQDFVRSTLAAAERNGAQVVWDATVRQLQVEAGRIVAAETTRGRYTAENYVLAAGLESSGLCRSVGINLPMQGAKGYVVDIEPAGPAPNIPVLFKEHKVVATPYPDRLRFSGTLELGSDPHTHSERRIQAILDAGAHGLPRLKIRRTLQNWAGQRPCTADGVPALGRSRIRNNLVVAAGHGMWGLILAPITGELLAGGLLEGAPTLHEPAFSPDRFGLTRTRRSTRASQNTDSPITRRLAATYCLNNARSKP